MLDIFVLAFFDDIINSCIIYKRAIFIVESLLTVRIPDLSICIFARALSIILALSLEYQLPIYYYNFEASNHKLIKAYDQIYIECITEKNLKLIKKIKMKDWVKL